MTATPTPVSKFRLFCKWAQLILSCICIGLFVNSPIDTVHSVESVLLAVTFGGFIIIQFGIIVGFTSGERVPKKVDLFYTLVGLALFIAAGSVGISHYKDLKKVSKNTSPNVTKLINTGMATGTIAIVNAIVFLFDAVSSYKDVNDYSPQE